MNDNKVRYSRAAIYSTYAELKKVVRKNLNKNEYFYIASEILRIMGENTDKISPDNSLKKRTQNAAAAAGHKFRGRKRGYCGTRT